MAGGWARRHKCTVLRLTNKITYHLWAGDGQDGISAWFHSYRERSRTGCGWAKDETESVRGSALKERDHIQAVEEQLVKQEVRSYAAIEQDSRTCCGREMDETVSARFNS